MLIRQSFADEVHFITASNVHLFSLLFLSCETIGWNDKLTYWALVKAQTIVCVPSLYPPQCKSPICVALCPPLGCRYNGLNWCQIFMRHFALTVYCRKCRRPEHISSKIGIYEVKTECNPKFNYWEKRELFVWVHLLSWFYSFGEGSFIDETPGLVLLTSMLRWARPPPLRLVGSPAPPRDMVSMDTLRPFIALWNEATEFI